MNALEILPAVAHWYSAADWPSLNEIAAAFAHDPAARRTLQWEARVFSLPGDASTFKLIPGTFDVIFLGYQPSLLRRLFLRRKCSVWLKPSGNYYEFEAGSSSFLRVLMDLTGSPGQKLPVAPDEPTSIFRDGV